MIRQNPQQEQRHPHTNRPRLLKVVLENEETKWSILKECGKLKDMETSRSNIRIMPDRTFKERQAHKVLVRERETKNKELQDAGVHGKKWIVVSGRLKKVLITKEVPPPVLKEHH